MISAMSAVDEMKELHESYINYVRLSLAIAILRNKPKHLSGQSYAEKLQHDLESSQMDWKAQYETVKEELLVMKQNHLVSGLSSGCGEENSSIRANNAAVAGLASRREFLSKISSLKRINAGVMVIQHAESMGVIINSFVSCFPMLANSLLEMQNSDSNSVNSMRTELISYHVNRLDLSFRLMVEILQTVDSVRRCPDVQNAMEEFLDKIVSEICCGKRLGDGVNYMQSCLLNFAKISESHSYLCQRFMASVVRTTGELAEANGFQQVTCIIDELEAIPIVTSCLQDLNSISPLVKVLPRVISLTDAFDLQETLDKLLTKFPLYSIHVREMVEMLGLWVEQ